VVWSLDVVLFVGCCFGFWLLAVGYLWFWFCLGQEEKENRRKEKEKEKDTV
jgi:phage shock protein PspC (stress-responsive transcriptional regulator)